MFEERAMKRVRRSDLRSPSRSLSPSDNDDIVTQEALRAKLRSAIELDIIDFAQQSKSHDAPPGTTTQPELAEEEEENTFAFKLFAAAPAASTSAPPQPSSTAPATTTTPSAHLPTNTHPQRIQLITLDDLQPSSESGTLAYPLPKRPLSYYFSPPASAAAKARFADAAIETSDVLNLARMERRGLACPWRVIREGVELGRRRRGVQTHGGTGVKTNLELGTTAISSQAEPAAATSTPHDQESNSDHNIDSDVEQQQPTTITSHTKRRRKSKKSRIALRMKLQKRRENEQRRKDAEKAKEEHVREKKTRMNRLKQLKKREKARLARGEGVVGEEGGDGGGGGEGGRRGRRGRAGRGW